MAISDAERISVDEGEVMKSSTELQSYHHAWLSDHPNRSEEWLKRMMAEGFHIHHIDGNHSNDDPMNLVLIEGADHFLLHNGKKRPVLMLKKPGGKRRYDSACYVERKAKRSLHVVEGQEKTKTRNELLQAAVKKAAMQHVGTFSTGASHG
jgi:hypothetical protein